MKYNILYVDPPWEFQNKNTGGSMKSGANAHYNTMSIDELMDLDIDKVIDENSVLFMWWVGSQPQVAIDLVNKWGFKLKNMNGFVWVKKTKNWKDFFGMGFWTRQGSENCLIAVRGNIKRDKNNIRSVVYEDDFSETIEAINERHSKKPNIFRKKIVELMGDVPRLEMFAREKCEGFDVWGDEIKSDVEI